MNKVATIPVEPSDDVIRQMLAVIWPATYRQHLRYPGAGPKSAAQTEKEIAQAIKQYAVIVGQASTHQVVQEHVAEVRGQKSPRHPEHICKYIVPLLDLPEGTKLYMQPDTGIMQAQLNKALEALAKIAAIEDEQHGGDWDEIEEARNIANAALTELKGEQA